MKAQALTHEQVLPQISEFYHSDFRQLAKSVLQSDEDVIWAGNTTHLADVGRFFGFGYLITSYRIIHVSFIVERGILGGGRETIHVEDKGYSALDIPHRPLSAKELITRSVGEVAFQSISQVRRREVKARTGHETTLVELSINVSGGSLFPYSILFYSFQDGQEVYEFLQNSIRNRNMPSQAVPDIADQRQLAKLAKLHQDKAITKEEYEAAKRKLLG